MINFDGRSHKYTSVRNVVYGTKGMAASTQPLASSLGIEIMKNGGNAIDAAVAMAGLMPLIEPTGNGLGSDGFYLIWTGGKLYGLNASGFSPKALNAEIVKEKGYSAVPGRGWLPVMVPGAVGGWVEMNRRFGTKKLTELWTRAAEYAVDGFPVATNVNPQWQGEYNGISAEYKKDPELFGPWMELFGAKGKAPLPGEIFKNPDYAKTIMEIAKTEGESFYRGELMKKIVAFSKKTGGYFEEDDFTGYKPEWVEPISINYKGYDVYEMPPNGHGITALMALQMLKGFDLGNERENAELYHKLIECIKLAFVDTKKFVADPRYMRTKVEDMLSDRYADVRRALIGDKAVFPEAGDPSCGDTVYFCTADGQGNMVSCIQSNYGRFGSGVCIPGTAITLQNRGANFSLDPESDNYLEGGKRAYHTIIPGFLAKDGQPVGPFGVMGGFMQPQGHMMVVVNTIDFGMTPQEALDAPRFQWVGDKKVQLEREVPAEIARQLAAKGHQIEIVSSNIGMGRGQIIWRRKDGVLMGGTESRADGAIAAF